MTEKIDIVLERMFQELEEASAAKDTWVKTGLATVDEALDGGAPVGLTLVQAGNEWLTLFVELLVGASTGEAPVLAAVLTLSPEELAMRLLAKQTGNRPSASRLGNAQIEPAEWRGILAATSALSESPLTIASIHSFDHLVKLLPGCTVNSLVFVETATAPNHREAWELCKASREARVALVIITRDVLPDDMPVSVARALRLESYEGKPRFIRLEPATPKPLFLQVGEPFESEEEVLKRLEREDLAFELALAEQPIPWPLGTTEECDEW